MEMSIDALLFAPLVKQVIESGKGKLTKFFGEGYSTKSIDDLVKVFVDLNGRIIYENVDNKTTSEYIFIWPDACVEVYSHHSIKTVGIQSISLNDEITKRCKEIGATFEKTSKKGYVFAITKAANNALQMTRMGFAGVPLEKGNYPSKTISDYEAVIDDFKSKTPSGRLAILDGPPGTGKSYMVKAMLLDIPNAIFVVVPSNMVSSIGGPELIPLLLKTKQTQANSGPTILILEDADECLAPRASDNISSISSILQLGDGLFGSLFDVRIIATTNAQAKEIDRAITREGRLTKRISIGPVVYEDANRIFQRIIEKDTMLPKPESTASGMRPKEEAKFTLAEIYKAARNAGWKPKLIEGVSDTVESPYRYAPDYDYSYDDEEYY
jgi:hypothetical protein